MLTPHERAVVARVTDVFRQPSGVYITLAYGKMGVGNGWFYLRRVNGRNQEWWNDVALMDVAIALTRARDFERSIGSRREEWAR